MCKIFVSEIFHTVSVHTELKSYEVLLNENFGNEKRANHGTLLINYFMLDWSRVHNAELEITGRHRTFAVHFTKMTDQLLFC